MRKVVIGVIIAIVGLALAASLEPKSWGDVWGYVLGGAAGIMVLLPAILKGIKNWKELLRSKSFWTGASVIVASVQMYISGQIDLPTMVFALYGGLVAIFLRDAVASTQAKTNPGRR